MATAKRDLTNPPVQGHTVHPLDKMIAIAVRIAEREGLLARDTTTTSATADELGLHGTEVAGNQGRASA